MSDDGPTHGEEYGACEICGKTALPMLGHFLCSTHGTLKHARRLDDG